MFGNGTNELIHLLARVLKEDGTPCAAVIEPAFSEYALACGLAAMARDCATARGIDTIVCSGGVLHNRLLAARLTFYLADFTLLFAQQLPAGDGAIAYGQAVIAAARVQTQGTQQ